MTKVIMVQIIRTKKIYFFGSVSAIFERFSEAEIGMTKGALLHAGLGDGVMKVTGRAIVYQSHLIRCHREV